MVKAADIADDIFLAAIARARQVPGYSTFGEVLPGGPRLSASIWDIQALLRSFPPKVVIAKARILIRRNIIDGCACGCRGDFTRKGG